MPDLEELGGEEALGEVVDAAVPLAPGQPQDPGLGQRLEDGPDLVGRAPVPVDRRARRDVGRRQRTVAADPVEQLLDQRRVLVERGPRRARPGSVPGDAIPGQLRASARSRAPCCRSRTASASRTAGRRSRLAGSPRSARASTRSWLRPVTSSGSNWSEPSRSMTRSTDAGSGASDARRCEEMAGRQEAARSGAIDLVSGGSPARWYGSRDTYPTTRTNRQ